MTIHPSPASRQPGNWPHARQRFFKIVEQIEILYAVPRVIETNRF
jgi:hypothetical protein